MVSILASHAGYQGSSPCTGIYFWSRYHQRCCFLQQETKTNCFFEIRLEFILKKILSIGRIFPSLHVSTQLAQCEYQKQIFYALTVERSVCWFAFIFDFLVVSTIEAYAIRSVVVHNEFYKECSRPIECASIIESKAKDVSLTEEGISSLAVKFLCKMFSMVDTTRTSVLLLSVDSECFFPKGSSPAEICSIIGLLKPIFSLRQLKHSTIA